MARFPFVGGSYTSRSLNFDAQRTINLYVEVSGSGASVTPAMLIGTPGLRRLATVGQGPIRGLLRVNADVLLVASGRELYRLDRTYTPTLIGGIKDDGPVSMASNGKQVMLVTGQHGYFVQLDDWAIAAADPEIFTGADRVDFLDGRFVWNMPGTGQFMWTGLYTDELNALSFATAEGSPDDLVSLIVDHRELWLFGRSTTEVWGPSGDANLPIMRIDGAVIEHGCAAAYSVAKLDNTVFWLGADDRGHGVVWRAAGYSPQRISTHAVEFAIGQYARVDDALAWTYQQEGHSFYVLLFPSAGACWVYDAATQLWHERAWRDSGGRLQCIRGVCQAAFGGEIVVGDREDGRLYALDLDTYTDDGDAIARVRTAPHVNNDGALVTVSALRVDFETGVGLPDGHGSEPMAYLEISKDGGHSWSNRREAPIGRIGERRARAMWRRLGQARDWVLRVTVTDPVPVRVIGASLEAG